MKNVRITSLLVALIGGFFGAYVFEYWNRGSAFLPEVSAATTVQQQVISASRVRLTDGNGKLRAELAMSGDGGPALFFFDNSGRNRMVLGLYSPAEGEYPFVVLNDTRQNAAGIFRLFGARETPVVVLKKDGRDRSIYGLNPNSSEPFLVNYSSDGRKSDVFGKY